MRQVATWIVVVGMAAALSGCGHDRVADGPSDSAEQAVREMLDALARGDARPLCKAVDLREAFAAASSPQPFETFAEGFLATCAEQVAATYVVGDSAHQVVGQYQDGGRTVVKVRFRAHGGAAWAEWDLPFRRIDGAWRMGLGGVEAILGLPAVPPATAAKDDETPASPPPPAVEPPEPVPDPIEQRALAMLRDFVEAGGDVNEALDDSHLLDEPAMDVTRLHVAAERGWLSVVRYLVEHGASVEAVAPSKSHHNQLTALDVARGAGHPRVAAYLEQVGTPEPRAVAHDFVEATRRGDLEAAKALCSRRAVESLLPAEADGEHESAITAFDVREVQVTGEQATADVWVRNQAFPDGEDEFRLVLTLRREGRAWRVDDLALEPWWEPADLGPEVDR